MDVADVLEAAADYLRENGWQKYAYGGHGHPACSLGAIREADRRDLPFWELKICAPTRAVETLLHRELDRWNDEQRTKKQVITALMEAAARVRLGEIKP